MCIRSTGRDWKSYVLIIKWHWDQNENCGASQSAIRNPINLSCSTKSAKYRLESANLSDSRMSTCDSQSSARISQPPIFICTKHWLNKHEYEIRLIFLFCYCSFPFIIPFFVVPFLCLFCFVSFNIVFLLSIVFDLPTFFGFVFLWFCLPDFFLFVLGCHFAFCTFFICVFVCYLFVVLIVGPFIGRNICLALSLTQ